MCLSDALTEAAVDTTQDWFMIDLPIDPDAPPDTVGDLLTFVVKIVGDERLRPGHLGPPAKLSKSHSAENLAASSGPAPFPGSPDNPAEHVDYGGSDDTSESSSPAATPEPPAAAAPSRCEQEMHPNKGVILVSEAFTEINAGVNDRAEIRTCQSYFNVRSDRCQPRS